MNTMMKRKFKIFVKISFPIIFSLVISGVIFALLTNPVYGQITENWTEPTNLSNSGGANIPRMTITSDGSIHVLWRDIQDGITFTSNLTYTKNITRLESVEEIWTNPVNINSSFETYIPALISNNSGNIHAFWLDDRGRLIHSRIDANLFGLNNSWSRPVILDEYVVGFDAAVDQQDSIHITYLRNFSVDTKSAGVYYRKSNNFGSNWSQTIQLSDSKYLRSIQKDNANIKVVSTPDIENSTKIYIVWDNPLLRRVNLIQSNDAGESWEPIVEIDKPINPSGLSSPFNIDISANQDDIVIVWQVGQKGVSCSLYSKQSNNGGETWSPSQRILSQLSLGGCPKENQIIGNSDNFSVMMTNTQDQIFLTAWNGQEWSDPQLQPTLASFVDPISLSNVDFGCHQSSIVDERLYIVGCDNGAGSDIWFTNSPLGELSEWFPPPSVWTDPAVISSNSDEFNSPQIVSDTQGGVHAFWTHPSGIYYSRWDGEQWIQPSEIITSPFTDFDHLAAGIDEQNGILYLVWTTGDTGDLFFSWANIDGSTQRNEWAEPISLSSSIFVNSAPDIYIDDNGIITVIFSVAINEGRGVYCLRSNDNGKSWENPWIIFNAVDAGWEIVEQPRVSKTDEGSIVATWLQSSPRSGPFAVFFSRIPEFENPKQPLMVAGNNIIWHDIHGDVYNYIHRIWHEVDNEESKIWHSYSNDFGLSWTTPNNISSIGEMPVSIDLTADQYGQPHLTYITKDDASKLRLKHWIWNGKVWQPGESVVLDDSNLKEIINNVSTINDQDEIYSIYSQSNLVAEEEVDNFSLLYTKRLANISEPDLDKIEIQILPEENTQLITETPITETPTKLAPTPIPTQVEIIQDQEQLTNQSNYLLASLFLGIGLALVLIVITLSLRLLIIKARN
jgi:hypothetical protein